MVVRVEVAESRVRPATCPTPQCESCTMNFIPEFWKVHVHVLEGPTQTLLPTVQEC